MTRLVEVVITDDHAKLFAGVLADKLENEPLLSVDARDMLDSMFQFFAGVAAQPEAFPVRGTALPKLRRSFRKGMGPAQPQRKPRRMTRHKARIEAAKARRAARKAAADGGS